MGAFLSIDSSFTTVLPATRPHRAHPTWVVDDIPDLTGKVAIVTGAFAHIEVNVLYAKWVI